MKRICPFCKSSLHTGNVYFCTYCGGVLPDNLQIKNLSFRHIKKMQGFHKGKTTSLQEHLNEFLGKVGSALGTRDIMIGAALGVILSIGFYFVIMLTTSRIPSIYSSRGNSLDDIPGNPVSEETPQRILNNVVDLDLDFEPSLFGQKNIYSYVPYEADFYIEFSDISTLEPYFSFLGGEFFTLTENIKNDIEDSYGAFFMNIEGKEGWVLIVYPSSAGLSVGSYSNIKTAFVDEALIISKESSLIEEVKSSKEGSSKNLILNPIFISIKPLIPSEGRIFMLKISDTGDEVVRKLLEETYSDELKSVIGSYRETEFNYFIVK